MTRVDDQRWLVELKQMRDRIDAEISRIEQEQRSRDERKHSWQLIRGGLLTVVLLTLSGAVWTLRQLRDHTTAFALTAATASTGMVVMAIVLAPVTERDARGESPPQPQETRALLTPGPRDTDMTTLAPTAPQPPGAPGTTTSAPATSSGESEPPSAPPESATSAPATSSTRDQPSTTPTSTTEPSPAERPNDNGETERPDDNKHDQGKPHDKDRCLRVRPHLGVDPHACLSAVGEVLQATI
ncbi:hypothetical protein ACH347_34720 [Saccharopolyspora sp. 5N102]|uniref:hypothetical protein n=1 Tax=Saccharopolyspora sp. 5N102 TaxID=3375155 RepID=UPI0037A01F78